MVYATDLKSVVAGHAGSSPASRTTLPTFEWAFDLMNSLVTLILFIAWVAGAVLAKGFWLTTLAIIIPFYSWYLVMEQLLKAMGWV